MILGYCKNGCISSQKELETTRQNYTLKIHSKEKELLELQQAVDSLKVRPPENPLSHKTSALLMKVSSFQRALRGPLWRTVSRSSRRWCSLSRGGGVSSEISSEIKREPPRACCRLLSKKSLNSIRNVTSWRCFWSLKIRSIFSR